MNDSTVSGTLGVRKRVDSTTESQIISNPRKRPRVSSMAGPFSLNDPISIGVGVGPVNFLNLITTLTSYHSYAQIDRLPRPQTLRSDESGIRNSNSSFYFPSQPARPLSGNSSFTAGSRAGSPLLIGELASATTGSAHISRSGMALMRSVSSASLRSSSPAVQVYPENSAKHFLRNTKATIDYSPPPNAILDVSSRLLSCSFRNTLFFTRGNRVHYKNLTTSEEVGQLCKLQDCGGDLRVIECGGIDQPDIVALGTTKGIVQIWDVQAKKITMNWTTTKEISAMRWNGPVLTIGGLKGTIRHYDIRINPIPKMKEQARKVTRHQAPITSLNWNVDGKYLASGDAAGTVYCWEPGQKVPLDVGEFIQRRKKIQHVGAISVIIIFSPWHVLQEVTDVI
jgi:cell division cycle protein 20 (cofactor of APC complex)